MRKKGKIALAALTAAALIGAAASLLTTSRDASFAACWFMAAGMSAYGAAAERAESNNKKED